MGELDKALLPLIIAGGAGSPSTSRQHSAEQLTRIAYQIYSASIAGMVCAQLGDVLDLQRSDAYRLGAAAGTALSSGQAALAMLLHALNFPQLDDPPLQQLLHSCAHAQLAAVAALFEMDPRQQ